MNKNLGRHLAKLVGEIEAMEFEARKWILI